eukprot:3925220-Rhodomonas_salina.1
MMKRVSWKAAVATRRHQCSACQRTGEEDQRRIHPIRLAKKGEEEREPQRIRTERMARSRSASSVKVEEREREERQGARTRL